MRVKCLVIFCIISGNAFSQSFEFNFEDLIVKFEYQMNLQDSVFTEKIVIYNDGDENIYIPDHKDHTLYNFILGTTKFSYLGVKNTKFGPTNLGGSELLMKITPQDSLVIALCMPLKIDVIKKYNLYFDFLRSKELRRIRKFKTSEGLKVKTTDYVKKCKSILLKCNLNPS